jgi:hypothetical protein
MSARNVDAYAPPKKRVRPPMSVPVHFSRRTALGDDDRRIPIRVFCHEAFPVKQDLLHNRAWGNFHRQQPRLSVQPHATGGDTGAGGDRDRRRPQRFSAVRQCPRTRRAARPRAIAPAIVVSLSLLEEFASSPGEPSVGFSRGSLEPGGQGDDRSPPKKACFCFLCTRIRTVTRPPLPLKGVLAQ